jgi:hypothetical protein
LVHKNFELLRDHSGHRAYGVADSGVLWHYEFCPKATSDLRVIRANRSTDSDQGRPKMYPGVDEPGERAPLDHTVYQDAKGPPTAILCFNPRIVGERGFQDDARSRSNDVLIGTFAKVFGSVAIFSRVGVALFCGQDQGTEPSRFHIPALLLAKHMHRITRGERCNGRKATTHQSSQSLHPRTRTSHITNPAREFGKGLPNTLLNSIELNTGVASRITVSKLRSERCRSFRLGKPT